MIDLLTLNCGCQWDNGSWDVCLFHRYKDGAMDKDGPIPLSGLDEEPRPSEKPPVIIDDVLNNGDTPAEMFDKIRSIFSAASGQADPYEASTRQANAEREARKAHSPRPPYSNHCPTCTCKKER